VGKVFRIGKQSMSFSFQAFWNTETRRSGPTWSLNPQFSLLFP
jgi:hypothetical protein